MIELRPITISAAIKFVRLHHRHLPAVTGGLWAVSVVDLDGDLRGVAIVGRPCRMLQDGYSAEIVRVATDGSRNACSMLYGACRRAAKALGYRRLYTYTLGSEPGTSLRAAGFRLDGTTKGGEWSRPSRPRAAAANSEPKQRWMVSA